MLVKSHRLAGISQSMTDCPGQRDRSGNCHIDSFSTPDAFDKPTDEISRTFTGDVLRSVRQ